MMKGNRRRRLNDRKTVKKNKGAGQQEDGQIISVGANVNVTSF